MRKAGRLSLSIAYYHNISFAIAAGGCVLTHFSGGLKSVRIARSPNSRGRLSLNFCHPARKRRSKTKGNQDRGSPRLEKKKKKKKRKRKGGSGGRWSVVVRGYSGVSGWILVSAMRVEWGEMCEVGSTQKA